MIKTIVKWAGYIVLGLIAYVMFLYWTFPFDQLKGRLEGAIEKSLGPDYDVRIANIAPSFVTGVVMKGVSLSVRSGSTTQTLLDVDKAKLRVGLFSLIFGNPEATFSLRFKKSTIEGSLAKDDNIIRISAELDPLLISNVPWFANVSGLQLDCKIAGTLTMAMPTDGNKPSEGSVNLSFQGGELKAGSKISLGEMGAKDIVVPMKFAESKDSKWTMKWSKGVVDLSQFKWSGGDFQLELGGQIFSGVALASTRLNIKGNMILSPEFEKEFGDFVSVILKLKQADGSYPMSVSGNLSAPDVSVAETPVLINGKFNFKLLTMK